MALGINEFNKVINCWKAKCEGGDLKLFSHSGKWARALNYINWYPYVWFWLNVFEVSDAFLLLVERETNVFDVSPTLHVLGEYIQK